MVAIVDGSPHVLNLKQILQYYLAHQENIITRRTKYDLKKAEARAHIIEGLRIALDHIDEIIKIIRGSKNSDIAKEQLITRFGLDDRQAQAILDMRLVRLTGLERDKLEEEYRDLLEKIDDYKDILAKPERVDQIIFNELLDIQKRFGDERRTEISDSEIISIDDEDLIEKQNVLLTLTHNGYIKRMPADEFKVQNRGGRGIRGMGVQNDDFINHLIYVNTHDCLLFFTNKGKVYSKKSYEIPEYGRAAKGLPIINLVQLEKGEKVQAVVKIATNDTNKYLMFVTKYGIVKRISISEFTNIRRSGLIALNLRENDELSNVLLTDGSQNILIGTRLGYAVIFNENEVRTMGRVASGVRGIKLRANDYVVGSSIVDDHSEVLVISEKGYGKRTLASEYPIKSRGCMGVKTANVTEKNGPLVGVTVVDGSEDLMLITDAGVIIRLEVDGVSQTGRATIGVRLIKLDQGTKVASLTRVKSEDNSEI